MPEVQTLPSSATAAEVSEVLLRDGAVIIEDAMSSEFADSLWDELKPYVTTTSRGEDEFSGLETTRTGGLAGRSARARDLLLNEAVIAQCDAILKPICETYQINATQVIRIMPGETAQPIHRDRWAWGFHQTFIAEPQLAAMWALTDFTKENGATRIAVGSRDWPDDRIPTDEEISYATMSRGSVLLFLGSVFHSGGANTSSGDRIGVVINYALGCLRQAENQYLSCPPEIASGLAPEIQALLGYTSCNTIGYYTPPDAPGAGPSGCMPPEHAVGRPPSADRSSLERLLSITRG